MFNKDPDWFYTLQPQRQEELIAWWRIKTIPAQPAKRAKPGRHATPRNVEANTPEARAFWLGE